MKKIGYALCILLIVACTPTAKKETSLLQFIPKNTQVIIKINDLEQAKHQLRDQEFIKKNTALPFFSYFEALAVLQQLQQSKGLLCFSPVGKDDYEYTYITPYTAALLQQDSLSQKKIEALTYANTTFHKVTEKGHTFFVTQQDNILIASSSQLCIENAIRQQDKPITIRKDLQQSFEITAPDTALSILIDGQQLAPLHHTLLPNATLDAAKNFSGWMAIDATITQQMIYLNGVAMEKDSLSSTIGIFDQTLPQENKIAKITPLTAHGCISYTYDDYDILKKNLVLAQDRNLKEASDEFDDLLSGISEFGIVFLDKNKLFSLTALDINSTLERLDGEKVSTYRGMPIYSYLHPGAFVTTLQPLITEINASFYTVYEDMVIFSSTKEALQSCIVHILNTSVIGEQAYYKNATTKLSDAASILMIGNTHKNATHISKNVSEAYTKAWDKVNTDQYPLGILQFIKEEDFAHLHSVFQKNTTKGRTASVTQIAATTLEYELLNTPILVKNHRTKGMDVAVQDINNHLYLISEQGAIFWKKQLDGPILGEIQQIDMYKNGRYQLAFATANTLYVLDRDGKDVAPFPKHFDTSITQPLAVFDYDKNKTYRLLVTRGNTLKMFDAKGMHVEGFRYTTAKTEIAQTPKHIRIGAKDHIIFTEKSGQVNILDRLGRTRVKVSETFEFSDNAWYQHKNTFATTTAAGNLLQIQTNGEILQEELALATAHHIVATNKTLVTFTDNILTIKGKTVELDYGVYAHPQLFYIKNKIYISITDIQSKKVYLYDSNAEPIPNFPVYGTSALCIGNIDKDPKLEFVVQGEDNSVLLYKMN